MLKMMKNKKIIYAMNEYRIYISLVVIYIFMAAFAPNFFNTFNTLSIMKSWSMAAMVAIGFTIVMIIGQFDLSIGAVLNLGAILVIGEFDRFSKIFAKQNMDETTILILSWIIAFIIALIGGAFVGFVNGYLVAKVKVHSFIVTIGMLTTVTGFIYLYCKGSSISSSSYILSDFIDKPIFWVLSPRIIIAFLLVLVFELMLLITKMGRAFFLVGGNAEAAWLAGINKEKYTMAAFIISGCTAALGGSLFAVSLNTAVPNFGEKGISPLMMVLAATIIGGTAMTGGKGSVLKSAAAVLTLVIIFNGLVNFGAGFEVQILTSGVLLALVVLYEAYAIYKQDLAKGQRPELLKEAALLKLKKN
ncbi:MAG: ABC transporter permease [Vallitaleaceae bacterium]|nr:ABC transporter permease [Vallitaleaceae bacterium]